MFDEAGNPAFSAGVFMRSGVETTVFSGRLHREVAIAAQQADPSETRILHLEDHTAVQRLPELAILTRSQHLAAIRAVEASIRETLAYGLRQQPAGIAGITADPTACGPANLYLIRAVSGGGNLTDPTGTVMASVNFVLQVGDTWHAGATMIKGTTEFEPYGWATFSEPIAGARQKFAGKYLIDVWLATYDGPFKRFRLVATHDGPFKRLRVFPSGECADVPLEPLSLD
jgi:hypothetical protein